MYSFSKAIVYLHLAMWGGGAPYKRRLGLAACAFLVVNVGLRLTYRIFPSFLNLSLWHLVKVVVLETHRALYVNAALARTPAPQRVIMLGNEYHEYLS